MPPEEVLQGLREGYGDQTLNAGGEREGQVNDVTNSSDEALVNAYLQAGNRGNGVLQQQ